MKTNYRLNVYEYYSGIEVLIQSVENDGSLIAVFKEPNWILDALNVLNCWIFTVKPGH